jgi:CRP-like cAMP-binding protein
MNEKSLKNISCEECSSKECLFRKTLPYEKLIRLHKIKHMVRYIKGQYIYHEGAQPSGIYCIHKGKVKIAKLGSEGKEQIIYLSKSGDTFGVKDVLHKNKYTTSSAALEDSFICHIPKTDFLFFLEEEAGFASEIRSHLCNIQDIIEEKVLNLSQRSVRERLAIYLIELNANFGLRLDNEESFIDLSLSRDELANLVGTATETLIRLISEFKKEEILYLKGKKITILKLSLLKKIAGLL